MAELISSGVELMFVGMGIVFLFLLMLVWTINVMSGLVQRYFPEASEPTLSIPTLSGNTPDKTTIAAIAAAVHQYRSKHKP
ncbi:oxaloacetate decarboxylase subunit gamma [Methylosoma difficile]